MLKLLRFGRTALSQADRKRRDGHALLPSLLALEGRALLAGFAGARSLSAVLSLRPVTTAMVERGAGRDVRVDSNVVYRQDGDRVLRLDVYLPKGPAPEAGWPVIVAIHGGGWSKGSKEQYGRFAAQMVRFGYAVVAPDYALARPGAASWPANIEDLREAVRWVKRNAGAYSINPDQIAAMGESAGGHLAALLGTSPGAPAPDGVSAKVQAVINFYGPTDLAREVREKPPARRPIAQFLGAALGSNPALYSSASPLRQLDPEDPPMLQIQGSADPLVPVNQAVAMASALRGAGIAEELIIIRGAGHGFGFQVQGRNLLPRILAFLNQSFSN